jgi:preprotein translocase subunit SecA
MIRVDHPDTVFTHRDAKERAIVDEIGRVHASGRPILVGTLTVEESERLARALTSAGTACQVLNARHDEAEARLVARAGVVGAVTIATNMAGRGTDIRLGGADECDHDRVAGLGGLYVIGTNRHESVRVDLQLRGRAGRQGDPGESRFFVSLEDDLLTRYGVGRLIGDRFAGVRQSAPIDHPVVRTEVARTQRIIEGQNTELRKTLDRYAYLLEQQQDAVMRHRQSLVRGEIVPDVWGEDADRRQALVATIGEQAVRRAETIVTIGYIDRLWRDHLGRAAELREGIHLVRLGGQDPLARFEDHLGRAFAQFEDALHDAVLQALANVQSKNGAVDLAGLGLTAPASTWTYLVNDDPFRHQLGSLLTGPGGPTLAIYAASVVMPLFLLWGVIGRWFRRRSR